MGKKRGFNYPSTAGFLCIKCGICCGDTKERSRHILLLKREAEEIAATTSQPISEFAKKILNRRPYTYEMKKTLEKGTCVFLANNRCTIYRFRPLICRFYPFELRKTKPQMYEFFSTEECPGVNKGKNLGKRYFTRLFKLAKERLSHNK
jgi:uncharacterized protein